MYKSVAEERIDRYKVEVRQYREYQRRGFLVVPALVGQDEVGELKDHAMDILEGRVRLEGMEPPDPGAGLEELRRRVTRVHMLHRHDPLSERFLLHPRILDVVEALVGPDVLALQTMLFFNGPGVGGQGWHQDSYYITTYPDSLVGSWLALDRADEETGCLRVVPGSNHEPVYPDRERGSLIHAEGVFADLGTVEKASDLDDDVNTLSRVAEKYESSLPVVVDPGDVVFFHSHLLHRSHQNRSLERWRRAFVSHYCNARSWVPWGHGAFCDGAANFQHILARGNTHLRFARPKFGTAG